MVVVAAAAVVRNRTLLLYRGNLLAALVLGFDPKILLVVKVVAVCRASTAEEQWETESEAMTPRSNNLVQYDDDGNVLLLKLIRF